MNVGTSITDTALAVIRTVELEMKNSAHLFHGSHARWKKLF